MRKFLNSGSLQIGLFLFCFAWLPYIPSQSLWVWKLSIVATEFAHWLAAASLILVVVTFFSHAKRSQRFIVILLGAVSMGVYSNPAVQFGLNFNKWKLGLAKSFGEQSLPAHASPRGSRLWSGRGDFSTVQPEELYFDSESTPKLALDFYRAANKARAPWVVVIHGGGWNSGDKKQLPELNSYLAHNGYAVVSVSYRLAPQWKWPAPREDVLKAVTFVKKNADKLGIDPNRWAILGRSAGGQIAQ